MHKFIKAWLDGKEVPVDFNGTPVYFDGNHQPHVKTGVMLGTTQPTAKLHVSQGVGYSDGGCGYFNKLVLYDEDGKEIKPKWYRKVLVWLEFLPDHLLYKFEMWRERRGQNVN